MVEDQGGAPFVPPAPLNQQADVGTGDNSAEPAESSVVSVDTQTEPTFIPWSLLDIEIKVPTTSNEARDQLFHVVLEQRRRHSFTIGNI